MPSVSPFEFLSVLVSIIVGLGITHLLSSTARLIQMRGRVRLYAPTLLWMAMLFLVHVQFWWATFERRDHVGWTFFTFLLFLTIPVLAYLLAYLLVPDLEGGPGGVDLKASFHANRLPFFLLLATVPVVSLLQEHIIDELQVDADVGFRVGFLALALVAARSRSERAHLLAALTGLVAVCVYILLLFLELH